ncbi:MAG: winged helix-turn-helix domain-containing protein [Proteobacteria bacterium]|nr:winged helix-turn-helix domain-containing protein [Pseudomonadota bacterium]
MKDPITLAVAGDEPALTAVLKEYALNVKVPALRCVTGADAAQAQIVIHGVRKESELPGPSVLNAGGERKVHLLVLSEGVAEPESPADELGLAGIFRKPVRLAALLDAGFSALRLSKLKSPRALSKHIRFDPFTRTLEDESRKTSQGLTPKEADLLLALLEAGEKGVAREEALTRLWGYHREADSHAVETAVWRLRRKLEALPGEGLGLESKEGVYYLKIGDPGSGIRDPGLEKKRIR